MENNIVDNILEDDDTELIENIMSLRRHIFSFIDKNKLIKFIVHLIDNSDIVSFERQLDKKYINAFRPSINLLFDLDRACKKYPKKENNILQSKCYSREKLIEGRANIIHSEIMVHYIDMLHQILCKVINNPIRDDFKYNDWLNEIFVPVKENIHLYVTNVQELPEGSKKLLLKDYSLVLGATTSVVFPTGSENINLDEDTGFTIEFMF